MEKYIHLQGVGKVQAIEAENLKKGSVLMWNSGVKSEVVDIMPRGNKQLILIEKYQSYDGKEAIYNRIVGRTRLVAFVSL